MELGIGMFGDNHYNAKGEPLPAGDRLRELIAEIKLMDEVGIDFFGIGEHHRPDYAVSVPEIVLAAASTVTKNIKLGSAVSVLSSSDPVRIYQSFATIDQISNGRAEIMAGRGSFIESFPLFGHDLKDYNELFIEKLDLLLKINQSETLTWKGKHRPSFERLGVYPRPYQSSIPVWLAAGGTPSSAVRAANLGLPLMLAIIGGMPEQFVSFVDLYKETAKKIGKDMNLLQFGINNHVYIGVDSQKAGDEFYPYYASMMN